MSETEKNLPAAFAGESQANRKYLAFAKQAEKEGFPNIARLFRAIAEAETVHAHNHLRAMGGIKSTVENLKAAIEGEHYEYTEMYPAFLEAAKKENAKDAIRSFDFANKAEKIHYDLYNEALKAAQEGKDIPDKPIYICPVCGHTVVGEPEGNCPICGAKKEMYMRF